jgi:hypothetical protein
MIDENGVKKSPTIVDLKLYVKIPKNTKVEQDTTCNFGECMGRNPRFYSHS